jgi:hypothetical protein
MHDTWTDLQQKDIAAGASYTAVPSAVIYNCCLAPAPAAARPHQATNAVATAPSPVRHSTHAMLLLLLLLLCALASSQWLGYEI